MFIFTKQNFNFLYDNKKNRKTNIFVIYYYYSAQKKDLFINLFQTFNSEK